MSAVERRDLLLKRLRRATDCGQIIFEILLAFLSFGREFGDCRGRDRLRLRGGQSLLQVASLLDVLRIILLADSTLGVPGLDVAELTLDRFPFAVVVLGQHPDRG